MRLYSVTITALFLCIIFCSFRNGVFFATRLEAQVQQEFLSYSAKKFISQSFKNTCKQKGFENPEQWQKVCKALFNLKSISYEPYSTENKIIHAVWCGGENLQKCSGEVYCKTTQVQGVLP